MLTKDPANRITIEQMRVSYIVCCLHLLLQLLTSLSFISSQIHPWITKNGTDPMISIDENCQLVVTEVTEEEISNAIKSVANIFTVVSSLSSFSIVTIFPGVLRYMFLDESGHQVQATFQKSITTVIKVYE
jgi:hypothetical protein